ncbi:hypothetical protein AVEN_76203-1 [Araneus ventricosus]|uniref:Integrase catalytic domain-containing protein n=1 Tax=Araneus ventricosus TaxID=182803 RepID=A0A4Y2EX89_ARAVE|nr:hypothetical protein AVEN_76203-1 [Araneus ventricosus]
MVLPLYVNNASLRELWDIESLGIREPIENVSKRKAFDEQLKEFHEKFTVLPDGRYEVEIPRKSVASANLPDNKELALKRQERDMLTAHNKGMTCFFIVFCMLILCFVNDCNKNSVTKSSKLTLSEIESAETVLIRLIQGQYFSSAKAVPTVDVFKDENGILRVKTRITEPRRGRPRTVYSDNDTNFRGAYNELSTLDWEKIVREANINRILWKFDPPTAFWWGGFGERLVRVIKELLRRSLGKSILSFEELGTVLCECKSAINSRPLTYVSENSDDLIPLTPSMFMIENRNFSTGDIDLVETQSFRRTIKFKAKLLKDFRLRLRKEYLSL